MLIELLRASAAKQGDRPFICTEDRTVTYADALDQSESLAQGLADRHVKRYAAVVSSVPDLVALMCASSAVGVEGCVYPAVLDEAEISDFAERFEHRIVVTDRPVSLTGIDVVQLASLRSDVRAPSPAPEDAPTLILTTGTTGHPKGARHSWNRLLATARLRAEDPDARWLFAYNLNQFAGIQVLLHVLASGATLVAPPSPQPRAALDVMKKFRVTHASATPTFWRFFARLVDDDIATSIPLRQITLGGEAVPESVLESLRSLFPGARISQVYASTEFGSSVSVRDGRHGLPLSVLDRTDDADVAFKIVDGELYARSRVGMFGYHGQGDADEEWRATGDLVEIRDDRIEFVGRTTDVINVGGVKVQPLVVENRIGVVEGVDAVYVHGRPNPISGEIVVAEVVAGGGADLAALEERIRAACRTLPPAAQPRRVKFVDEIPLRGNKILRRSAP